MHDPRNRLLKGLDHEPCCHGTGFHLSAVVAQRKLREEFSRLACASAPPLTSWRVRLRWLSKWLIFRSFQ